MGAVKSKLTALALLPGLMALGLASSVSAIGLQPQSLLPPPKVNVDLRIFDPTGKPIGSASVSLAGQVATTDASGEAKFINIPSGSETLFVRSGNKLTREQLMVLQNDKHGTLNYALTAQRGTNFVALLITLLVLFVLAGISVVWPMSRTTHKHYRRLRTQVKNKSRANRHKPRHAQAVHIQLHRHSSVPRTVTSKAKPTNNMDQQAETETAAEDIQAAFGADITNWPGTTISPLSEDAD